MNTIEKEYELIGRLKDDHEARCQLERILEGIIWPEIWKDARLAVTTISGGEAVEHSQ